MSEWINRKDRLPDETGYYVVWTERGGLEIAWYEDHRFSTLITHWRKGELCRPKPEGPFKWEQFADESHCGVFFKDVPKCGYCYAMVFSCGINAQRAVDWLNKIWAQHKP